jgi:hypothetical protein
MTRWNVNDWRKYSGRDSIKVIGHVLPLKRRSAGRLAKRPVVPARRPLLS